MPWIPFKVSFVGAVREDAVQRVHGRLHHAVGVMMGLTMWGDNYKGDRPLHTYPREVQLLERKTKCPKWQFVIVFSPGATCGEVALFLVFNFF